MFCPRVVQGLQTIAPATKQILTNLSALTNSSETTVSVCISAFFSPYRIKMGRRAK